MEEKKQRDDARQAKKDEQRKRFLWSNAEDLINNLDVEIAQRDDALKKRCQMCMEHTLGEFLKTEEDREEFFQNARDYAWGHYLHQEALEWEEHEKAEKVIISDLLEGRLNA